MQAVRSGGILLHPTSLPSPYGIGDLGPGAHGFIDWLSKAGCKLWQVLPLGPTGYGNSPYQCHSVFAGNPYLISPETLLRDGLLIESDLTAEGAIPRSPQDSSYRVEYGDVIRWKGSLLARAFQRFQEGDWEDLREEFAAFRAENAYWLEDFSLFMALKQAHGGGSWVEWPISIRRRDDRALADARHSLGRAIEASSFYQLLFFHQWAILRQHAHQSGIQIIGDLPIFAAEDSSDVWAHQGLFYLDGDGVPTVVSGVPPDYFSPTGQLWGNPLYRWEAHERTGYGWWVERLRSALRIVDFVRLDHFRGFAAYWEIPAGNPTAEFGRWVAGPGADFLDAVANHLDDNSDSRELSIIAEDLGVITPDVVELRERYHLPGMRILQFGFSGPDDPFLPHNYVRNCVAYTGTHDNDTARGWFETAPENERDFALRYLHTTRRSFVWDMIRAIWSSVAMFAIAPMQDLLNLGTEARMNFPSVPAGNWEWRMTKADMNPGLGRKLRELNELYGRS